MCESCTKQRNFEDVCAILEKNGYEKSKLIPILQEVQNIYRYLPEKVLYLIANSLKMPPSKVFGVATFYSHFTLTPKGKYVVKICNGTACHVKGSMKIYDALRERLGLEGKSNTSADMMFTIETVSCLGACGLAPAVVINDKVYGQVEPKEAVKIIEGIMQEEGEKSE